MKIDTNHLSNLIFAYKEKSNPFLLWISHYPEDQELSSELNFLCLNAKDIDEGQLESLLRALLQSMTHQAIWLRSGDSLSSNHLSRIEEVLKQQPARCIITSTQGLHQLAPPKSFFGLEWVAQETETSSQPTKTTPEYLKDFIGVSKMPSDESWNRLITSLPEFFAKEADVIDESSKEAYFEIVKRLEKILSATHSSIWAKRQLIWSLHSYMKKRHSP